MNIAIRNASPALQVTFILSRFPCLSETFILSQITGLLDRGVKVRVVAASSDSEPIVHEKFRQYQLHELATVVFPQPRPTAFRCFVSELSRNPLAFIKTMRPWRFGKRSVSGTLQSWCRVMREVESVNRSDVVVAHFGHIGDLAVCLRQAGAFDAPVISVVHGSDIAIPLFQRQPVYPRLKKWGDLVLPISERWKHSLLESGFSEKRVRVHHVGVEVPEQLIPSTNTVKPVKFLSVNRLCEKKGIEYAIRAVSVLAKSGHGIKYSIIGSGPLRNQLEALVQELNLGKIVHFLGPQSADQVHNTMLSHDVFLAPSVTAANGDQEGIPTAIMEAMSRGLLVVSTRHSGIPELVDHGVSGTLVQERDSEELAVAIETLLSQPERHSAMREQAFAKVESDFNIEKLNNNFKEILCDQARLSSQTSTPAAGD